MDESMGIAVFLLIIVAVMVVSLSFYIIQAIALMRISENRGYDKGWLAWIPIANAFLIPILVNDDVGDFIRGRFPLVFGLTFIASIIPFIGFVFSILMLVLTFYGFYSLVRQYSTSGTAYLIISIVTLGVAMPFLLFRIRNREIIA